MEGRHDDEKRYDKWLEGRDDPFELRHSPDSIGVHNRGTIALEQVLTLLETVQQWRDSQSRSSGIATDESLEMGTKRVLPRDPDVTRGGG